MQTRPHPKSQGGMGGLRPAVGTGRGSLLLPEPVQREALPFRGPWAMLPPGGGVLALHQKWAD